MKAFFQKRLDPRSIRVALTYLAIIMIMSVGFSSIFYKTSIDQLPLQLQTTPDTTGSSDAPSNAMSTFNFSGKSIGASGSVDEINKQLQEYVAQAQGDLLRQLIMLNCVALVLGSLLSYYLARKTLRPIEVAMEVQSRFASDASHELRTPLTVIQTEIDVVLRSSNLTLERAKQALRNNREEVTKLRELSEGLLRLTHAPHMGLEVAPLKVDELVSEAMGRVVKTAQKKHISIAETVPKLSAHGDFQSLVQVLVILLDNAIKYSPSKSTVHIEGRADNKFLYLDVRDEGLGIRASDLPHIFDRFYRADTSRSNRKVSGYGLGLSIAKKIIDQHKGAITVSSVLDEGSTFSIKIPL